MQQLFDNYFIWANIETGGFMDKNLEKRICYWVIKVGKVEAQKQLVSEGIALSTVQRIVSGTYESQPRTLLLNAIEAALKKSAWIM